MTGHRPGEPDLPGGIRPAEASPDTDVEPGAGTDVAGDAGALGLAVCRLSLDPERGRIRHGNRVGIGIRGAVFAELILDGRIGGLSWPKAVGAAETGDRMPDAVHAAVRGRQKTNWKRWFAHVGADLDAASAELIRLGVWHRDPSGRLRDADPGLRLAQSDRIAQVVDVARSGSGGAVFGELPPEDAAVALLATGAGLLGGRPRPRAALAQFDRVLPARSGRPLQRVALRARGEVAVPDERDVLRAAVHAALVAMRGQAGARFMSG